MFDADFYSPSIVIYREQLVLVRQVALVLAAVSIFQTHRQTAPAKQSMWSEWEEATLMMTIGAKAFIYELATLRQLAVDVIARFPQFKDDGTEALAGFDAAVSFLVDLRNSQAHIDERLNFRSRGRRIQLADPEIVDPHRFGLISPPHVVGSTIQGTIECGEHAVIAVNEASVAAAEALTFRLFASVKRVKPGTQRR